MPYAGVTMTYDEYTSSVQTAFDGLNIKVTGIHQVGNMSSSIAKAQCIIIGGGNTFSLLAEIQRHELLFDLRDAARGDIPFVGWSAGSNMACPSIKTTNDMPIEEPDNFSALHLINFQINPHYTEATIPNHGGESRDLRLQEFLVKNQHTPVVGLPEGMLLEVEDEKVILKGTGEAKLFNYGRPTQDLRPGEIEIG